ncbi:hypothetical protein FAZ19_09550 [Sphingobacterium alkalisoli]|uniref:Uncharacterized protein n=1 Tax=Sphingobacterium alkalisoli TaxID=1874115 RepID=A0A4U0H5T4_9SPHI|nr:hypothetical protein FAZ19_09550 [Sphingobacterium alkalisoli]GGH12091.1 hypothetical protein GCM10011418_11390 [Sphingobacterium alkalisoli]
MSAVNTIAYAKKEAREDAFAFGIAKGGRKKAIEIALSFKKMGTPIADIAEGTGVSIEELRRTLRSKIEKLNNWLDIIYKSIAAIWIFSDGCFC